MDYRNLFKRRNAFTSANFSCSYFQQGGQVHLIRNGDFPMLFVLEGGIIITCEGAIEQTYGCGDMVIVDHNRISEVSCLNGTILMEYAPPKGLTRRIKQHPNCFAQPCLPIIPITGRLENWVEQQLLSLPVNGRIQDNELLALLVKYQKHRLKIICKIMKEYLAAKKEIQKTGDRQQ